MPRESKRQKALRYLNEDRVEVVSANAHGLRLLVRGGRRDPYEVAYGKTVTGRLVESCTCDNAMLYHPVRPRCAHVEIAKMLHHI